MEGKTEKMTKGMRYGKHAANIARALDEWWRAEKELERAYGGSTTETEDGAPSPKVRWGLGGSDEGVGKVALSTLRVLDGQGASARLLEGVEITEERGHGTRYSENDYKPWGFTCTATSDEEGTVPEKGSIRIDWSRMPHVWDHCMVCRLTKERNPRSEKVSRWWNEKRLSVEAAVDGEGQLAFMGVPDSREWMKELRAERKVVTAKWSRADVVRVYRNTQYAHYDETGRGGGRRTKRTKAGEILMANILGTGPEIVRGYLRLLIVSTGMELLWGMVERGVYRAAAKEALAEQAEKLEGVNGFEVELPDKGGRTVGGLGSGWGAPKQLPVHLALEGIEKNSASKRTVRGQKRDPHGPKGAAEMIEGAEIATGDETRLESARRGIQVLRYNSERMREAHKKGTAKAEAAGQPQDVKFTVLLEQIHNVVNTLESLVQHLEGEEASCAVPPATSASAVSHRLTGENQGRLVYDANQPTRVFVWRTTGADTDQKEDEYAGYFEIEDPGPYESRVRVFSKGQRAALLNVDDEGTDIAVLRAVRYLIRGRQNMNSLVEELQATLQGALEWRDLEHAVQKNNKAKE